MNRARDQFSDNFQLIVFSISYTLSCMFLYGIFLYFAVEFQLLVQIFFSLGFLVASILVWAHLFVLFSIPQKLAGSFDYIKNDISTGAISDPTKFSIELNSFLIQFFNYSFFDIQYSIVNAINTETVFSDENIKTILNWKEIEEKAAKSPELQRNGKVRINNLAFYCYTTPIFFNDQYLGFFTVFSKQKLGRLRLKFLCDIEENFIDDQLIRIISTDK